MMESKVSEVSATVSKCGVALSGCSAFWAFIETNHQILTVGLGFVGLLITIVASGVAVYCRYQENQRREAEHKARLQGWLKEHGENHG